MAQRPSWNDEERTRKKLEAENQRLLGEYDYYKNGYERRGELLDRILAVDPLFHYDLLDEIRKELSDE